MRHSLFNCLCATAAWTVLTLLGQPAWAGPKVQVGKPCGESNRPSLAEVAHAPFTALLQKYVDDKGLVAYAKWKASVADTQALDDYLTRAGCVDLKKPAPKAAQVAFWVNVYNALTLKGILREYPIKSIRDRTSRLGGYNIWKDLLLWVDNKTYSLDDIEHQILRKMSEPRVHAALVCGAKGCPPLSNKAYTATGLDAELTANGQRFFARPDSFRADPGKREVHLTPLLKWYGQDFGPTTADQLRALRPLLPESGATGLVDNPDVRVRFLDYDWGLNDQQPPSR
ncbi:MAG: DUF547 domain-containing protein [Gemmataceae bacterium]